MIDADQCPEYFEFASQRLNETWQHGPSCKCLASLSEERRIRGVVIYDNFTEFNCFIHVASDGGRRFISKEFLAWTFRIPFLQWKKRRITALARADNHRVLEFDRALGFVQEGVIRCAFGDQDGIVLGMLKEECRYLTIEVK